MVQDEKIQSIQRSNNVLNHSPKFWFSICFQVLVPCLLVHQSAGDKWSEGWQEVVDLLGCLCFLLCPRIFLRSGLFYILITFDCETSNYYVPFSFTLRLKYLRRGILSFYSCFQNQYLVENDCLNILISNIKKQSDGNPNLFRINPQIFGSKLENHNRWKFV